MERVVWLMRTGKSACDKEDEQSRVPQAMALFSVFVHANEAQNIKHVVVGFLGNLHKPPNCFPFYINATLQVPIIP